VTTEQKTVLIIDDSALVRRQVREALASAGYDAIEAHDGVEALASLRVRDVALVITDFTMPQMSGLELIQSIRGGIVQSGVPIIVLSTLATGSLVQQGWDAGVHAWLKKPFKPAMLLSAVASVLTKAVERGAAACGS
jgi:two-component system chemotaxis response regulator CheY